MESPSTEDLQPSGIKLAKTASVRKAAGKTVLKKSDFSKNVFNSKDFM
jgi:hypothetical protein